MSLGLISKHKRNNPQHSPSWLAGSSRKHREAQGPTVVVEFYKFFMECPTETCLLLSRFSLTVSVSPSKDTSTGTPQRTYILKSSSSSSSSVLISCSGRETIGSNWGSWLDSSAFSVEVSWSSWLSCAEGRRDNAAGWWTWPTLGITKQKRPWKMKTGLPYIGN